MQRVLIVNGVIAPGIISLQQQQCINNSWLTSPAKWKLSDVCLICDWFIHSVGEQDYWKSNEPISLKISIMTGPTSWKNLEPKGSKPTTFQQILPTLTFLLYSLDCLHDHGTRLDLSISSVYFLVFFFYIFILSLIRSIVSYRIILH